MALKKNIGRHLFASLTGEGYSDELARDFWPSSEDLWDSAAHVKLRWPKLLFVYSASAFVQIMIPASLVFVVFTLFMDPNKIMLAAYWTGGVTGAGAFMFAVIFATATYVSIIRKQKGAM